MGRGNINIFGTKFAYPRGLRKSPGRHWMHSCMAMQLQGKKHTSRAAAKIAFSKAAKSCSSQGNK